MRKMESKEVDLLNLIPHGIKCDNPDCGWYDMSIKYEEYEEYIDKPCPCCGENLLTKECYIRTTRMVKRTQKLNTFLNKIIPVKKKEEMAKTTSYGAITVNKDGRMKNAVILGTKTKEE